MMHVGDVQYHGGNHDARGGCSVPWGDIMMHVGDVQYHGGIS